MYRGFMRVMHFILVLITTSLNLAAVPLKIDNSEDYHVLNQFFKEMVVDSEYGYVLDGVKPTSQMNVDPLNKLMIPQAKDFKMLVLARQAMAHWQRLAPEQKENVLKIVEIKNGEGVLPSYGFSFINVSKLKSTLEANIDLFRYVLGPALSSDKLVESLVRSQMPIIECINHDMVLQGIIMGFGAYNSLMHSRIEKIQNAQPAGDILPFATHSDLMSQKALSQMDQTTIRKIFLANGTNPAFIMDEKFSIPKPKLGFATSEEELDYLVECYEQSPKCLKDKPCFIFGAYRHPENQQLFAELVQSQKNISQNIKRNDLLVYILEKITGESPIIAPELLSEKSYHLEIKPNTEEAIAKMLWQMSFQFDEETVPNFVEAFCQADRQVQKGSFAIPGSLKGLKRARANLKFADNWFSIVPYENAYEEIVPGHLYFEQIRVGKGEVLNQHNKVLVSYVIEDGFGNVLAAEHKSWLNLSDTISGFALGMQGIKAGESRMLYIHPAFAYGVLTTLPPCLQLQVKVTLHEIAQDSTHYLPNSQPIDLAWVKDPGFYHEVESGVHQLATVFGSRWGTWLKRSKDIDFAIVCSNLKQLAHNVCPIHITKEEELACNRVFWNLITEGQEKHN